MRNSLLPVVVCTEVTCQFAVQPFFEILILRKPAEEKLTKDVMIAKNIRFELFDEES